jgi:glycosyltransferase involved in cell wall biosynthesis
MPSVTKASAVETPRSRILWLTFTNLSFSNLISQVEVAKALAKRNKEVYLFTIRSSKAHSQVNAPVLSGVHIVSIPLRFIPVVTPMLYVSVLAFMLPFYVITKRPSYVITERGTAILCLVFKRLFHLLKSKVVMDIRSPPVGTGNSRSLRDNLNDLLFRSSLASAKKHDGMTILTTAMRDEICSNFNIEPDSVGVWTSGTSTALFNPEKYDGKDLRGKLGLSRDFIVFYHGVLAPTRGLFETIKALAILRDCYPDLKLFFLGSGPSVQLLKNAARKGRVEDRVIIHEQVDYEEVPKYVAICDVGIVPLSNSPEWRYQSPLKLLEYLSMGKPVIVTDIPANRDIIGNSKCGIFIPSIKPEEIARAISFAEENKGSLVEWGSQGRSIVERKFSWERVAGDLDEYLRRI